MVRAAVQDPRNAETIAALTDLLWVMHRSRMLQQQGTPALALVLHLNKTGPMRSSDLAGAMHLDQSTVSRHLSHLDSAGLITRTPDPGDRRAQLVEVTEAGRQQAHELVAARVLQFERVISVWSDQDRDDLARLLGRFSDDFANQLADEASTPQPDNRQQQTRDNT